MSQRTLIVKLSLVVLFLLVPRHMIAGTFKDKIKNKTLNAQLTLFEKRFSFFITKELTAHLEEDVSDYLNLTSNLKSKIRFLLQLQKKTKTIESKKNILKYLGNHISSLPPLQKKLFLNEASKEFLKIITSSLDIYKNDLREKRSYRYAYLLNLIAEEIALDLLWSGKDTTESLQMYLAECYTKLQNKACFNQLVYFGFNQRAGELFKHDNSTPLTDSENKLAICNLYLSQEKIVDAKKCFNSSQSLSFQLGNLFLDYIQNGPRSISPSRIKTFLTANNGWPFVYLFLVTNGTFLENKPLVNQSFTWNYKTLFATLYLDRKHKVLNSKTKGDLTREFTTYYKNTKLYEILTDQASLKETQIDFGNHNLLTEVLKVN